MVARRCVSFGAPRVGNHVWARTFDGLVPDAWRVVADGDLITKVPRCFYMHAGVEVVVDPVPRPRGDGYLGLFGLRLAASPRLALGLSGSRPRRRRDASLEPSRPAGGGRGGLSDRGPDVRGATAPPLVPRVVRAAQALELPARALGRGRRARRRAARGARDAAEPRVAAARVVVLPLGAGDGGGAGA